MKKEIIAAVLLIVMFTASLVNIHYLDKLTGEIVSLVEEADKKAFRGDWDGARGDAERALEMWENSDGYTHLVLRHAEIEDACDTLAQLLKEIYAENAGASRGAAKAAVLRMRSIASIEHIKLGSIF